MISFPAGRGLSPRRSLWILVDPRIRVLVVVASSALALGSSSLPAFVVIYIAAIASYLLSGTGPGTAWRGFRPFAFLIILTAGLQIFFAEGVPLVTGVPVVSRITGAGLAAALLVLSRLSAVILFSTLLVATTTPYEISRSLAWILSPLARLGAPVGDYMLIMNMAFQFFPTLAEETGNVRMGLESRGISLRHERTVLRFRATAAWMLAVLTSVLERSHRTAAALQVKGGGRGPELRLRFPPWSKASSGAVALVGLVIAAWLCLR